MTALKKSRTAQYALQAEFAFNIADTVLNADGVTRSFSAAAPAADVIPLPPGATIVSGSVTVETVSDETGTATITVGDSASAARYLGATNLKAAAFTPLVPTGYRGNGEDIRITLANQNGNAANGKVTVRVAYVVAGRAQEVQTT